ILASGEDPTGILEITEAKPNGRPGRKYTYHEAWPCRWKAPKLNANSDTYIVEELEFAVERVERG
ncbi:MAG TPA: phage tail protein, partial [Candidatus Hydrogenedentes bacterium]|nr:phage tail protein [Candidatus Hydrogenedentota bacterium]